MTISKSRAINIIGLGRIGSFFQAVTQGNGFDKSSSLSCINLSLPTMVCVRMENLQDLLSKLLLSHPKASLSNLIFVQNGIYDHILKDHGIVSTTKVLIYFAIAKPKDSPVDGHRSIVSGKHTTRILEIFHKAHLTLKAVDHHTFQMQAYEKLMWLSIFGLLCTIHKASVSQIVHHHKPCIATLTQELTKVIEHSQNTRLDTKLEERLCDYALSLGDYTASLKEYPYRNGWFVERMATPYHMQLLNQTHPTL